MKFILFVEGHTEAKAIPSFLKRWLDPRLARPVGIQVVRFEGWKELVHDSLTKARLHLQRDDVIAVIGLLDLYGPTLYPEHLTTAGERCDWAKSHLEAQVKNPKFLQFFAVHETEAWLLSDPSIFPNSVRPAIERISRDPEAVNNTNHPSKRLAGIYLQKTKRTYKKVTHGRNLFAELDPNMASQKCPHLKELLETMLELAQQAGH